jgi:hypothetical protein
MILATSNVMASAGIFKQSMGARNRVGIELSYRAASLQRLAEWIPWNWAPISLKIRAPLAIVLTFLAGEGANIFLSHYEYCLPPFLPAG